MRHYQSLLLCCLLAFSCSDNDTDIEPKPETMVSEIRLSLDNLSFDCIGGEETVKIELDYDYYNNYNPRWQLSGDESWCTPSETTGYSYDEVTFTVKANDTSEERKAIFTFTCGKVSQNLTISQAAYYYFSIHVAKKGTLASVMAQNNLDIKKSAP